MLRIPGQKQPFRIRKKQSLTSFREGTISDQSDHQIKRLLPEKTRLIQKQALIECQFQFLRTKPIKNHRRLKEQNLVPGSLKGSLGSDKKVHQINKRPLISSKIKHQTQ